MLLIDAFETSDIELTLAELTRRTGMPKPTVRRLMQELVASGLLEDTAYGARLGLKLLELGSMVQQHSRLRRVAMPYLRELGSSTGLTVHLGILDRDEVLYLEKLLGRSGPPIPSRVGGRMPAYATGLGKAMLALSPAGVSSAVLQSPMKRLTPRTQYLPGQVARELDRIRARGSAFDKEESVQGVVCAAAPILDSSGVAVGGLSLSGWSPRLDLTKFADVVCDAARSIGNRLGSPTAAAHLQHV
jgi:DNA-binding IclR family transcriptional regulator